MNALSENKHTLTIARLITGLAQGLFLYLLFIATQSKEQGLIVGNLFVLNPLIIITIFLPLLIIQALGNIRRKTLLIWSIIAAISLICLAYYDTWLMVTPHTNYFSSFSLLIIIILFISQSLILSGDHDQKLMAYYTTYFDTAWTLCIQLILVTLFVLIFWSLLFLGAGLFSAINISFFWILILKPAFFIPTSSLVITVGFILTDIRPSIVRGLRTLILLLLSYLLPITTIITICFLSSLPFTGFAHFASSFAPLYLLFHVSISLIIFINAAYQVASNKNQAQ